jgi:hypothetical protein
MDRDDGVDEVGAEPEKKKRRIKIPKKARLEENVTEVHTNNFFIANTLRRDKDTYYHSVTFH